MDKRKACRVQGGWSSRPSGVPLAKQDALAERNSSGRVSWSAGRRHDDEQNERDLRLVAVAAADLEATAPLRVISEPGIYELSHTSHGASRLKYFRSFFESSDADWMLQQLRVDIPWQQKSNVTSDGRAAAQPRLTYWISEFGYNYSGVRWRPNPHWPAVVTVMRDRLAEQVGVVFNSVLLNLYRDGHDSVDWHSDDELPLGIAPLIASLSFGATRNFELRPRPPAHTAPSGARPPLLAPAVRVPLEHGSLLLMEGATQTDWQHRVPKEYHDRAARINLTFRVMFPT